MLKHQSVASTESFPLQWAWLFEVESMQSILLASLELAGLAVDALSASDNLSI